MPPANRLRPRPPTAGRPLLRLDSKESVERFVDHAGAALPAGRALVRVTDQVGESGAILVTPSDPSAEVVAHEPPCVVPGGLTALTTYLVVAADVLDATEHRVVPRGAPTSRAVRLVALSQGTSALVEPAVRA